MIGVGEEEVVEGADSGVLVMDKSLLIGTDSGRRFPDHLILHSEGFSHDHQCPDQRLGYQQ
ncbi:hypothetical protein EG68_10908 [Paragonimus skrjabini miyazakii]|uniref:Uncharacterized protein n=1 Tax=Paragonimus skrjabini miyazakii TaxID=59628 RepID=A0A8S9YF50_9TREM|nr:hypothetical protein EG68_10908 [Paragonimus skrjabini miyazakii]